MDKIDKIDNEGLLLKAQGHMRMALELIHMYEQENSETIETKKNPMVLKLEKMHV